MMQDANQTASPLKDPEIAYPLWFMVIFWLITCILSSLTILGNLLVLVSYYVEQSIRQPSNYIIASLAISDLMIGLEGFPIFSLYITYGEQWIMGRIACELWLCIDYTVCLTSILTVLLITVDRYCSVCYPAIYRCWLSPFRVQLLIVFSWFLPTTLFSVTIFGWQKFTGEVPPVDKEERRCVVPFLGNAYLNMALYMTYYWAVLVAIIVLYHGIHKAASALEERGRTRDRQTLLISTQLNMAKMGVTLGLDQKPKSHLVPSESYAGIVPSPTVISPTLSPAPSLANIQAQQYREQRSSSGVSGEYGTFTKSATISTLKPNSRKISSKKKVTMSRTHSQMSRITRSSSSKFMLIGKDISGMSLFRYSNDPGSDDQLYEDASLTSLMNNPLKSPENNSGTSSYSFCSDMAQSIDERLEPLLCAVEAESSEDSSDQTPTVGTSIAGSNTLIQSKRSQELSSLLSSRSGPGEDLLIPQHISITRDPSTYLGFKMVPNSVSDQQMSSRTAEDETPTNSEDGRAAKDQKEQPTTTSKQHNESLTQEAFLPIMKVIRERKRKQSRAEKRARKAFRTITVIVGAFALFWSPYYIVATIYGFCKTCIPPPVFIISYYMCYMNSLFNPACYALANLQYRRCFARLLQGDWSRH